MLGCDAHPAQVQPCHCQDAAPQVPRGTILLPRTHEGSCLPPRSPNAAIHGLFLAAEPFPLHPVTTARALAWPRAPLSTSACSANPQGMSLCSRKALPPSVSPEMSPAPQASEGSEAGPYGS